MFKVFRHPLQYLDYEPIVVVQVLFDILLIVCFLSVVLTEKTWVYAITQTGDSSVVLKLL